MSSAVHIINRSPPCYCPSDQKSLSHSRIGRRAAGSPPCTSSGYYQTPSLIRFESLRCTPKKALVCRASSSGPRRNPDLPRQKKQGFSRGLNRTNKERDKFESLEESEPLSSRNGSPLCVSDTSKFQATAVPGPKEKEVVELFRKVQAQLRERAAVKEEKKIEALHGKGKDNETVDSLLKLLRKHSVEQGKRGHTSSGSRDFITHHQSEPNDRLNGDKYTNFSNFASPAKVESKPLNAVISSRPVSNFRKRSPVPQMKFKPVYIKDSELKIETHMEDDLELEQELDQEAEAEAETEPEPEPESQISGLLSNMTILHEEESSEEENSDSEIEEETVEDADLASLKMVELRALAKARGLKGVSKMKKAELVQLLSKDTT